MSTDQERAAFEAAMIAKAYPSHNFQRDGAGMYYSPIIYAAFVAWQTATARQASEIEALRKDAERLDWLDSESLKRELISFDTAKGGVRSAIDAAKEQQA